MRRLVVIVAVVAATALGGLGLSGLSGAAAKEAKPPKPPVTLSGTVHNKGTKNISAKATATLKLEQDNYYFEPTFIQVQPGEVVTVKLKNEGNTVHTFTSSELGVNQMLNPDKSATVKVTIPTTGTLFAFHCEFHEAMGMQGAFYVAASTTATTGSAPTSSP